MDAFVTWLIIAIFYAPLHYLIPIIIVFFQNVSDPELRKKRMIATAIDCTLSMTVAFALVIWLSENQLHVAMYILMLSMATPYLRVWLQRRKAGTIEAVAETD
jgi:hypothetical protein